MKLITLIASVLLLFSSAFSQSVHISSDCSCINLRSDSVFDEIISSVVFTLSWPSNQSPSLESGDYMLISKSGSSVTRNGRAYQTFTSLNFDHLSERGEILSPDEDLCIMKFSGANVRLETEIATLNTEFYISLNGKNSTGLVDSNSCEKQTRVTVYPNPANNVLTVVIFDGEFSSVRLNNSAGKLVYSSNVVQRQLDISLTSFADGQYTLSLIGDVVHVEKIIIQR